jgi:chromosome segregation ATPase
MDKQTHIKHKAMKKILMTGGIVAAAALLLTGCENYKDELTEMTNTRDSLMAVSNAKDQSIEEFINSFEEIESGLFAITEKENLVRAQSDKNTEMTADHKSRIQAEVSLIGQMLEESKQKTAELTKKLKNSNFRVAKFEKMIASLNEQIAAKDQQLATLGTEITNLNLKVESLSGNIAALESREVTNTQIIADQTARLNKAYIAVGDYKKLRDDQVVTREGGFLGLGKEEKLASTINKEAFSEVDITRIQTIPLDTKEAELVTVHPAGSYSLEKQDDKVRELVITDADKFWSTSKYLVVMTK